MEKTGSWQMEEAVAEQSQDLLVDFWGYLNSDGLPRRCCGLQASIDCWASGIAEPVCRAQLNFQTPCPPKMSKTTRAPPWRWKSLALGSLRGDIGSATKAADGRS